MSSRESERMPRSLSAFLTTVQVFRPLALVWAILVGRSQWDLLSSPTAAAIALAFLSLWTLARLVANRSSARLETAEVVIVALVILTTKLAYDGPGSGETLPLSIVYAAASLVSIAAWTGWRGGVVAGVAISLADLIPMHGWDAPTVSMAIMRVLGVAGLGYGFDMAWQARAALAQARHTEALTSKRLDGARSTAESVLQTLTMLQQEAGHVSGAEVIEYRARSTATMVRRWMSGDPLAGLDELVPAQTDVRRALLDITPPSVTLSAPDLPVVVATVRAQELLAAVTEALRNIALHAGANPRASVLLTDDGVDITVRIQDRGVGFDSARPGTVGLPYDIRQRIENIDGEVFVSAIPRLGTTIEMRVPKRSVEPGRPR